MNIITTLNHLNLSAESNPAQNQSPYVVKRKIHKCYTDLPEGVYDRFQAFMDKGDFDEAYKVLSDAPTKTKKLARKHIKKRKVIREQSHQWSTIKPILDQGILEPKDIKSLACVNTTISGVVTWFQSSAAAEKNMINLLDHLITVSTSEKLKPLKEKAEQFKKDFQETCSSIQSNGPTAIPFGVEEKFITELGEAILSIKPLIPEISDSNKALLLTCAACVGEKTLNLFLQVGIDIKIQPIVSYSPLHYALYLKQMKAIERLAKAGADIHSLFDQDDTFLSFVVKRKDFAALNALSKAKIDLNPPTDEGRTALYNALVEEFNNHYRFTPDLKIFKALIKAGMQVTFKNKKGKTLLHGVAYYNTAADIVKVLIAAGAEIDAIDQNGSIPLKIAVCKDAPDVVKALIKAGANLQVQDNFGSTPLHLAVFSESAAIVQLLIDAKVDVNTKDRVGNTPLHLALKQIKPFNHYESSQDKINRELELKMVKALLMAGADVTIENLQGETPLGICKNIEDDYTKLRKSLISIFSEAGIEITYKRPWPN